MAAETPLEPPEESPDTISAAEFQRRLDDLEDKRREERFVWIVLTTILATVAVVGGYASSALPLAIVLLELPLLFLLAKKMGIEDVARLIDRIISNVGKTDRE